MSATLSWTPPAASSTGSHPCDLPHAIQWTRHIPATYGVACVSQDRCCAGGHDRADLSHQEHAKVWVDGHPSAKRTAPALTLLVSSVWLVAHGICF